MKRYILAHIILAALFTSIAGCAGLLEQLSGQQQDPSQTRSAAAAKTAVARAKKLAQEGRFAEAVATYRQVLQDHPGTEWSPDAKYGIALAYVAADNPQKDYAAGVTEFDEFVAQFPKDKRAHEAQSWRLAIKSLLDAKRENERLSKTLEKLKMLDVQQEERRLGR